MIERITQLRAQAESEIAAAGALDALEQLRVRYLGRKAELPQILRGVAKLEAAERATVRQAATRAGGALQRLIDQREAEWGAAQLQGALEADRLDVPLPGAPPQPIGRLHLLSATRRELEDIFIGLGFTVMEGPEVETVHYNF